MNENKLPEYDPWTGESNPLLEEVRKEEEFGKFGKSSSLNARFEETTFTPEDGVELILDFLAYELPITSRYITRDLIRDWIAKRYQI
jgi:hypothetical protein